MSSRYRLQYDTFLLFSRRRNQSRKIHDDDDDEYDDDNDPRIQKEIPQLPPASSSSRDRTDNDSIINLQDNSSTIVGAVQLNRKLQLQYTCNVCETRNIHSISRIAYTSGVVIARCKGCDSQHIIADHLGWTDYKGGFEGPNINTIEDYFSNERKPKVDDETDSEVVNDTNDANANSVVNRVTQEVFELEKMLRQYDMKSGSIIGDDGKLAME